MTSRNAFAVLGWAAVTCWAATARAEDVVAYEADGGASSSAGDARTDALDDAFARATASALAELVAPDVRAARKLELDRELVGHARLWVVKFTVTKDEITDDRRQLVVSVRIDRDKLRDQLAKLKIEFHDPGAPASDAATPARTVTILERVTTPAGVGADYGQGAVADVPGLAAITRVVRAAGMAVRRAPASGAAARGQGELPLDDDEAAALATEAKAELVAVAGITVGAAVAIRGQAGTAALVTAHVKLFERKDHKLVGQGISTAAARGDDPAMLGYAVDRAVSAALADVIPPAPTQLARAAGFHGDDTPIAEAGLVLLRLPAKTPFHLVLDEQKYLAGARGIRAASLRRLSPAGWVIGVATNESIERVAQIAKKPPATDTTAAVKIVGDVVEVALSGSP